MKKLGLKKPHMKKGGKKKLKGYSMAKLKSMAKPRHKRGEQAVMKALS